MILSSLKNRLRSRIPVAILTINYVLEARLRTYIQRAHRLAFVQKLILLHTYNEILRIPCLTAERFRFQFASNNVNPAHIGIW